MNFIKIQLLLATLASYDRNSVQSTSMKIIIRCDSSYKIGSGHIFRCLNLADQLNRNGHDVSFASRELDGNIIHIIVERQFKVYRLSAPHFTPIQSSNLDYQEWLAVPKPQEIADFLAITSVHLPDWVIVDHYGIDSEWERCLTDAGVKVFALDDLGRPHHVAGILDQNLNDSHAKRYQDNSPSAHLFLGPQYAALSESFLQIRPKEWNSLKQVSVITVFFGGADPTSETLRFLKLFPLIKTDSIFFNLVIGIQNNDRALIENQVKLHSNIELFIQINHLANLLSNSQFFIGSGGTITWEKCKLALPSLCIAVADNQVEIAKNLDRLGIQRYLGTSQEVSDHQFVEALNGLIQDEKARKNFHEQAKRLQVSTKFSQVIQFFEN